MIPYATSVAVVAALFLVGGFADQTVRPWIWLAAIVLAVVIMATPDVDGVVVPIGVDVILLIMLVVEHLRVEVAYRDHDLAVDPGSG